MGSTYRDTINKVGRALLNKDSEMPGVPKKKKAKYDYTPGIDPTLEGEKLERQRSEENYKKTIKSQSLPSADLDLLGGIFGARQKLLSAGMKAVGIKNLPNWANIALGVGEGVAADKVLSPAYEALSGGNPNSPLAQAFLPYLALKNPKLAAQYAKVFKFDPRELSIIARSQGEPDIALKTIGGRGGVHARRYNDLEDALNDSSYYSTSGQGTGGTKRAIAALPIRNPYIGFNEDSQGHYIPKLFRGDKDLPFNKPFELPRNEGFHDLVKDLWRDPKKRNKFWTSAQQRRLKERYGNNSSEHPYALGEAMVKNKVSSQGYEGWFNVPGSYTTTSKYRYTSDQEYAAKSYERFLDALKIYEYKIQQLPFIRERAKNSYYPGEEARRQLDQFRSQKDHTLRQLSYAANDPDNGIPNMNELYEQTRNLPIGKWKDTLTQWLKEANPSFQPKILGAHEVNDFSGNLRNFYADRTGYARRLKSYRNLKQTPDGQQQGRDFGIINPDGTFNPGWYGFRVGNTKPTAHNTGFQEFLARYNYTPEEIESYFNAFKKELPNRELAKLAKIDSYDLSSNDTKKIAETLEKVGLAPNRKVSESPLLYFDKDELLQNQATDDVFLFSPPRPKDFTPPVRRLSNAEVRRSPSYLNYKTRDISDGVFNRVPKTSPMRQEYRKKAAAALKTLRNDKIPTFVGGDTGLVQFPALDSLTRNSGLYHSARNPEKTMYQGIETLNHLEALKEQAEAAHKGISLEELMRRRLDASFDSIE